MNNLKVCFALGFFMLLSSGASQAVAKNIPVKTTTTSLQVLASVGPLEFLSGATVTIRNAKGKVLGQRKTNIRGSAIFYLSKSELSNLPFSAITSGGKIIGQTGNQFKGPAFGGHLKGEISDVSLNKRSFIYLDLLSTTAYAMRTAYTSYAQATQRVREAFDIGKGFPLNGLRFENNHTHWPLQLTAMKKNHGHDAYVRKLASRINRGNKIKELTPSRYQGVARSKTSPRIAQATASSTSTFPQCNVAVGNGSATPSSSSASTELIEDFGVLSMDALITVAGAPELVPVADAVVGMLLAGGNPGDSGSTSTQTQLAGIDTELNCITSQISYLSEQLLELELTTLTEAASTCEAHIQDDWKYYTNIVTAAQPSSTGAPAPVTDQLNNQNTSLPQWVTPSNGATWITNGYCEDVINDMLFSGAPGIPSAWEQINLNYQSENAWYTQLQVQQLQTFLSYWGTLSYQEWVVNNEYFNWNSQTTNAASLAGNISGTNTCLASTGTTMCNFQSNIANAYPGDLYSDEIGIWQSGMAVNAFPAGQAMTAAALDNQSPGYTFTQLNFNANYIYQWANKWWNASPQTISMGSWAVTPSYNYFNNQGIQPAMPNGVIVPSAIEQFSYPQALRTIQPLSTDVAVLANPGPGGQTALAFFLNAINYTLPPVKTLVWSVCYDLFCVSVPEYETLTPEWPIPSQWTTLPANTQTGVAFYTFDSFGQYSQWECQTGCPQNPTFTINTTNPIAGLSYNNTFTDTSQNCWGSSYAQSCGIGCATNYCENLVNEGYDGPPSFGVLLGRTFWPNSSCATTSPTSANCP